MDRLFFGLVVAVMTTCISTRDIFDTQFTADTKEWENNEGYTGGVSCYHHHVAFMAYIDKDHYYGVGSKIVFDKIHLNDGNGYNPSTGIFRAPLSGVYQFTFVITQRRGRKIDVNLRHNGIHIAAANADGRLFENQGTNTAIVDVKCNSEVYLQVDYGNYIRGDINWTLTTFSGHLLYAK